MIAKELSAYIPVGSVALVHRMPPIKGSALAPKSRFGVAAYMLGTQVGFLCPIKWTTFASKSMVVLDMKPGLNYAQFLNVEPIESIRKIAQLPTDTSDHVTIQLPTVVKHKTLHAPPITQVWTRHDETRGITSNPQNCTDTTSKCSNNVQRVEEKLQ